MGMYDDLTCLAPLPDGRTDLDTRGFQTKDLECLLDRYTITEDGRLLVDEYELHVIPEGKPKKPWGPIFDREEKGQSEVLYHGLIRFYQAGPGGFATDWCEYEAKFTEGRLDEIVKVIQDVPLTSAWEAGNDG